VLLLLEVEGEGHRVEVDHQLRELVGLSSHTSGDIIHHVHDCHVHFGVGFPHLQTRPKEVVKASRRQVQEPATAPGWLEGSSRPLNYLELEVNAPGLPHKVEEAGEQVASLPSDPVINRVGEPH